MGEKGIKWLNEIKIILPFCYSRGSPGRNNLLYYTKGRESSWEPGGGVEIERKNRSALWTLDTLNICGIITI